MHPLGSSTPSRSPGRWAAVGPVMLAVVFLVALVLAANHNDVLGWVIAVIAFGWLVLATLSYIGLYKVARFGAAQVRQAQSHLAAARGGSTVADGGTRLVETGADSVRDLKLDHSFKIIEVQAKVIADHLKEGDPGQVERALETIVITASNGRGMLGAKEGRPQSSGTTFPNDGSPSPEDGPITGTVIS